MSAGSARYHAATVMLLAGLRATGMVTCTALRSALLKAKLRASGNVTGGTGTIVEGVGKVPVVPHVVVVAPVPAQRVPVRLLPEASAAVVPLASSNFQ